MLYEDFTYEYYKRCNCCVSSVPNFILSYDEAGREQCPYCGGKDLGPLTRSALCSMEAYLRDMEDAGE